MTLPGYGVHTWQAKEETFKERVCWSRMILFQPRSEQRSICLVCHPPLIWTLVSHIHARQYILAARRSTQVRIPFEAVLEGVLSMSSHPGHREVPGVIKG